MGILEIIDCPREMKLADIVLSRVAFIFDAYVVTADKTFPYDKKIVLPMRTFINKGWRITKYEKLFTILMRRLHELLSED